MLQSGDTPPGSDGLGSGEGDGLGSGVGDGDGDGDGLGDGDGDGDGDGPGDGVGEGEGDGGGGAVPDPEPAPAPDAGNARSDIPAPSEPDLPATSPEGLSWLSRADGIPKSGWNPPSLSPGTFRPVRSVLPPASPEGEAAVIPTATTANTVNATSGRVAVSSVGLNRSYPPAAATAR